VTHTYHFHIATLIYEPVYTKPAPRGPPTLPPPYTSTPRSQPASAPPSSVSSPSAVPVPSSVFNTATVPSAIAFGSENQVASESRNSVPTPDSDRTPQASRHTSASHIPDSTITASPLLNLPPSGDIPGTAALTTSSGSSAPRNPALSSVTSTHNQGQDSPVMNETLSVIQEHISNMNSPRHSGSGDRRGTNDSGSEYSSHLDHRQSYINGEETDEEEESLHGEAEVSGWTPEQVADYLSTVGVEKRHCEIFREQEITGDVLLGMEQTSIFLKEFDLGSVGRRLKTWQKIKALQDEVKGGTPAATRRSTQNYGSEIGSEDSGRVRSQSHTGATVLPRIPSMNERTSSRQTGRYSQQQGVKAQTMQPTSPISPVPTQERSNTMNDSPRRPSAASIRDLHHSRRHSSNDFGASLLSNTLSPGTDSPKTNPLGMSHKKGPSFDRNWTMGSQSPALSLRPASSTGKTGLMSPDEEDNLSGMNLTTPWEFDRGYFSGGEIEGRQRNVLRKRGSASHSRNSSYTDEQRARSATTNARHSRFGSVDSIREPHISPASQKYYGMSLRYMAPSAASVGPQPPLKDANGLSPTVTKLDGTTTPRSPTDSPRSPDKIQSPEWLQSGNGVTAPRGLGLRAISDAVTGTEKSRLALPTDQLSSPIKEDSLQSPSRTGSTTSGGPSFELDSPSGSKAPSTMTTPGSKTSRKKSKKETSAYTRGLEKKTPKEQMLHCDYSGWMKKKSTNLMTTWKPRLFILKGRRLSYYYSEDDEQERGLIDISFHRVLPADNDRLTGLHATLTGATTSPTSPSNSHTQTIADKEAAAEPQSSLSKQPGDQMFIFKLMPPRSGLSRAVNFTKPTIHYFAVPNLAQGRLWMAALMKATIDRDDTKPITTTYQQKTISLAKARAMRHRPPALMNLDEKVEDETVKTPKTDLSGLNIRGIIFEKETNGGDSDVSDISKLDTAPMQKTSRSKIGAGGLIASPEKTGRGFDDALPQTA
jgi:hypothetical protein